MASGCDRNFAIVILIVVGETWAYGVVVLSGLMTGKSASRNLSVRQILSFQQKDFQEVKPRRSQAFPRCGTSASQMWNILCETGDEETTRAAKLWIIEMLGGCYSLLHIVEAVLCNLLTAT